MEMDGTGSDFCISSLERVGSVL